VPYEKITTKQSVGAHSVRPQIKTYNTRYDIVMADIIRPLITIEFEDGNFYRFIVERRVIPHSVGKCHAVTKGLGTCQVRRSLQYSILQIKIRSFAAVYVTYVVGCRGRQPLQILFRPDKDAIITNYALRITHYELKSNIATLTGSLKLAALQCLI